MQDSFECKLKLSADTHVNWYTRELIYDLFVVEALNKRVLIVLARDEG